MTNATIGHNVVTSDQDVTDNINCTTCDHFGHGTLRDYTQAVGGLIVVILQWECQFVGLSFLLSDLFYMY